MKLKKEPDNKCKKSLIDNKYMNPDERQEVLEDAGLDPDKFD